MMKIFFGLVASVAVLSILFLPNINRTTDTYTLTKEPERVCSSDDEGMSCQYLVFTDKDVFKNVDSIWHLKFDSSDFHSKMSKGQICVFDTVGFRIPIFSEYKNIVRGECYKNAFEEDFRA